MTDDIHTISAGGVTASIKADGAELCSLKSAGGLELLWQAGPAWPRHAPWLFPIVGRLKDDQLRQRSETARAHDAARPRSEEHTSELQLQFHLVCRLLLEKKKKKR